jgi:hypothetical protein
MLRTASESRRDGVYRAKSAVRAAGLMTAGAAGVIALAVAPSKAQVVGYVFAPVTVWMAWRFWLCGVHVESNGVRIYGWLRTQRVPWADIDRFTVEPAAPYPYVGRLIRKDGRRPIVLVGTGTGRFENEKNRREAQAPVDLLNERLQEWRRLHGLQDVASGSGDVVPHEAAAAPPHST